MFEPVRQIEAGGLVAVGTPLPEDLPTDVVVARTYRNPAIPGSVMTRFVPRGLILALDAELDILGFVPDGVAPEVGVQRRQTPGFPGQAVLDDPVNAAYALAVMKEFRDIAKRILQKPREAKEGFQRIAARLATTVPHFLPPYWEEVARTAVGLGDLKFAASAFDRARAAERENGLNVDERAKLDAYLEFALAGALSVKALQGYSRELRATVASEVAYECLRFLAVRRTLGGLPPWAGMAKDLRGLAKAAGGEVAAREQKLLCELLEAPALLDAPVSFWVEFRTTLIALCRVDTLVRGILLSLFPTGGFTNLGAEGAARWVDTWMELLFATGALSAVWDASAPPEAVPRESRAAWFSKLRDWEDRHTRYSGWRLQLARRAAPVLIAERAPIEISRMYSDSPFDLDYYDLLMELGVPCRVNGEVHCVFLEHWAVQPDVPARASFPAESRPRALWYVVQNPAVAGRIAEGLYGAFGSAVFESAVARAPGLFGLREAWLAARVEDLAAGGIGLSTWAIAQLERRTTAAHVLEFPGLFVALRTADIAGALEQTLRDGLPDEFHWPAFEEAYQLLQPGVDEELHLNQQWPYLIIGHGRRLVVLGAGGVLCVHDVALPQPFVVRATAWVAGQLFVCGFGRRTYENVAYWSGSPHDVFPVQRCPYQQASNPLTLEDSIVVGAVRFSAGDRVAPPEGGRQAHDRTTSWVQVGKDLRRQDRRTGVAGAVDAPPFLQSGDSELFSIWEYKLVPAVVAACSPVATLDGVYASRVAASAYVRQAGSSGWCSDAWRRGSSRAGQLQTLAGEVCEAIPWGAGYRAPQLMVRWPSATQSRPVVGLGQNWRRSDRQHFLLGMTGSPNLGEAVSRQFRIWARRTASMLPGAAKQHGWAPDVRVDADRLRVSVVHDEEITGCLGHMPPLQYWHFLSARDSAGSASLRAVRRGAGNELLDAAASGDAALDQTISKLFPRLSDPLLRQAVAHTVRLGVAVESRRQALLVAHSRDGAAIRPVRPRVDEHELTPALKNLVFGQNWLASKWRVLPPTVSTARYRNDVSSARWRVTEEIYTLGDWLIRGDEQTQIVMSNLSPRSWFGKIRALGLSATRPDLGVEERNTILSVLRAWRTAGLADRGYFRSAVLCVEGEPDWLFAGWKERPRHDVSYAFLVKNQQGRRLAVFDCSNAGDQRWHLETYEWSPDGVFGEWLGAYPLTGWVHFVDDAAWIDALLMHAQHRGPRLVTKDTVDWVVSQTGLTAEEATVALCSFGNDLRKETRALLGLKSVDLQRAERQFDAWSLVHKLDLLAAAAPDDPANVWDDGVENPDGAAARWVAAWLPRVGRVATVPSDLLTEAERVLPELGATWLRLLADYKTWHAVHCDGEWSVLPSGKLHAGQPEGAAFSGSLAYPLALLLPLVADRLPVGDPLRACVPAVYASVVARASHPSLQVEAGRLSFGASTQLRTVAETWFCDLPGPATELVDADGTYQRKTVGALVATLDTAHLSLVVRPSAMRPDELARLDALGEILPRQGAAVAGLAFLLSEGVRSLVARVETTPLAQGEWEQDARLSAPDVLAQVKETCGLGEDAALLYLQVVTLLSPTKRNCLQWNDWSPKRYDVAASRLVEAGLLVQARRPRAEREHFLPGGWVHEAEIQPYETWKRELYGWDGRQFLLGVPVLQRPYHELYTRAWARIASGDAPRLDPVQG